MSVQFLSAGGAGVLASAGAPASSFGAEGQFCVDTVNDVLYGPKSGSSASAWGTGRYIGGELNSVAGGLRGETIPTNDPAVWSNATRLLFHDRAYAMRFVPKRAWSFTTAEWLVTGGANADDHCEVGVYAGEASGARLATTGDLAGKLNGSVGLRSIELVVPTLDPRLPYYVVFRNGPTVGTNAATVAARGLSDPSEADLYGSTPGTRLAFYWDLTAGASLPANLPTFASLPTQNNGNSPKITLREI